MLQMVTTFRSAWWISWVRWGRIRSTNGRWDNALLYTQRSRLYILLLLIIDDCYPAHGTFRTRLSSDGRFAISDQYEGKGTFRQYVFVPPVDRLPRRKEGTDKGPYQ